MIPADKQQLLHQLTRQLAALQGMEAIVLGGSYASGTAHAGSDLDIGLYYHAASPFDLQDIRRVAEGAAQGGGATRGAVTVTGFYEWGAWVNGGAWIHTPSGKVDFLYRSLEHVQRTIEEAKQGILHHDYDQQPAYGFYSVIYLAETHICQPLYDPQGLIADLKQQVAVYPPKMKESIVHDSLWLAEFTLLHAQGFAEKGDVYNTVGCLTRSAACLTQVLFALNERYFIRDKQALETIAAFRLVPSGYAEQVTRVLAHPGRTAAELSGSVELMRSIWRSVAVLRESLTG